MNYFIGIHISIDTNAAEEYEFVSNFFPWIGLVVLIIAIIMGWKRVQFMKSAVSNFATVTQLREVPSDETNSILYSPTFTFVDNTGRTQTIDSNTACYPPKYEVNQQVEVVYHPESPEKAIIRQFDSLWYTPVMWGIAGLFLILIRFFLS